MNSFYIKILEADGVFYEGECISLIIPCIDGMRGIQANHANMISVIEPGEMLYRMPDGTEQKAAINYGMIKVEDGEVLILAEAIERPEEIDEEAIKRREIAAKEQMLQDRSIKEYKLAQWELAKTANRLRVKKRNRI
ncbi:MAG: ATP synthase F1 subunit epsilon [Firmicutes bacterium]|nr:ATP synthase F1 subunit epsilon [Bacillota bacterium]